jgi:hypothetical protein
MQNNEFKGQPSLWATDRPVYLLPAANKRKKMSILNRFLNHGWGVNETKISVLGGYQTKTKTPEAGPDKMPLVGQQNNNPLPQEKRGPRREPPKGKLVKNMLAPPPVAYSPGSEARQATLVSQCPQNATRLLRKDDYTRFLIDKKYFGNVPTQAKDALASVMHSVTRALPPDPDLPPELQGADMVLLMQSLVNVSKDTAVRNGVADVVRGLSCLRNINLLDAIRNPANATPSILNAAAPAVRCPDIGIGNIAGYPRPHDDQSYDRRDFDVAWRIAQSLGETPDGIKLLKKITVTPPPPANLHASVTRKNDELLFVYLNATREMAAQARAADERFPTDPRSIDRRLNEKLKQQGVPRAERQNPGADSTSLGENVNISFLEKGLLATRDHLRQTAAHAATAALATELALRKNGYTSAAVLIRNGIYTDELRDANGKPTPFALIQGRTEKLAKAAVASLNRVQDREDLPAYTPRALGKLGKYFPITTQMNKSPFNTYHRLGHGDEAIGFKQSENSGGIKEGRTIKQDLLGPLKTALRTAGGGTDQAFGPLFPVVPAANGNGAVQPNERQLRSLVRLALLEQKEEATLFLTRYKDGDPLNHFDLARAQARLHGWCGGADNLTEAARDRIAELFEENNLYFLPSTLMPWARDLGGPGNMQEVANVRYHYGGPQPGQLDWVKFAHGIRRAENRSTPPPPAWNYKKRFPDDAENVGRLSDRFQRAIETHELGSRIRLASGGVVGLRTNGIGRFFSGGVIKPIFAHDRSRHHVMEAGTGTAGNELVLATEKVNATKLGLGWNFMGSKANTKVFQASANLGFEGNLGQDDRELRGAVYRFRRLYNGGVPGDEANNAKLARLTKKVMDPGSEGATNQNGDVEPWIEPPADGDRSSILKRIAHEFDDVSVSWLGVDDRTRKATGSFIGSFGAKTSGVYGALIGGSVTHEISKNKQQWQEQGGSLHVHKITRTIGFAHNTTVTGTAPGIAWSMGEEWRSGYLDLASASAGIYRKSCVERMTLIEEDGEFKKPTFKTITFANTADLYDFVKSDIARAAVDKARKYERVRYHATPSEAASTDASVSKMELAEREATVQKEYLKLLQYLERQRANAQPNQAVQAYYEPKDSVVTAINKYQSLMKGAQKNGDTTAAKDYQERISKMINDHSSWEYSFLIDFDMTTKKRERGWNFIAKNQKVDSFTATRIRDYT